MVTAVLGPSGCGKTASLRNFIANHLYSYCNLGNFSGPFYVIEREGYEDYSFVFNEKNVKVMTPKDDLDFLLFVKEKAIVIDCEDETNSFLEFVEKLISVSEINRTKIYFTAFWVDEEKIAQILKKCNMFYVNPMGYNESFMEDFNRFVFPGELLPPPMFEYRSMFDRFYTIKKTGISQ